MNILSAYYIHKRRQRWMMYIPLESNTYFIYRGIPGLIDCFTASLVINTDFIWLVNINYIKLPNSCKLPSYDKWIVSFFNTLNVSLGLFVNTGRLAYCRARILHSYKLFVIFTDTFNNEIVRVVSIYFI